MNGIRDYKYIGIPLIGKPKFCRFSDLRPEKRLANKVLTADISYQILFINANYNNCFMSIIY